MDRNVPSIRAWSYYKITFNHKRITSMLYLRKIFSILLLLTNNEIHSQSYSFDIDKDGVLDEILLVKNDSTNKYSLHYTISSLSDKVFETSEMYKGLDETKLISFKNDNLIISVQHNRTLNLYTYKYIERNKDFVLIAVEFYSEGNAVHDGRGSTSWNLLNGNYIIDEYAYNTKMKKLVKSKNNLTSKIQPVSIYLLSNINDDILNDISTYLSEKSEAESISKNSSIHPKSNTISEKKAPIKRRNTDFDKLILDLADLTNDYIKQLQYYKRSRPHLITSIFIKKWQAKFEVYTMKLEQAHRQGKLNEEQIQAFKGLQLQLIVGMTTY